MLLDQGVINKRVHSWFDAVRDTGNKAVHEGFAAQRDALVEQAQIASRPPLSEVQMRRVIDRMLAQVGWVVQDVATTNRRWRQGWRSARSAWPGAGRITCSTSMARSSV